MLGQVGTNYGGDRNTEDWVSVTGIELPIATGEFTGGQSSFRVPSWAPGSSDQNARWSCRLTIQHPGRDAAASGDITFRIGSGDVAVPAAPFERVSGAGETVIEIGLPSPVWRAGELVRGQISLSPQADLPDGDLAVSWQRERASHPLTRNPSPGESMDGRPAVSLGNRIPLRAGVPVVLSFEVPLPADAAPTASGVHSSLSWFIQARMFHKGLTGPLMERVRLPIVVINAP